MHLAGTQLVLLMDKMLSAIRFRVPVKRHFWRNPEPARSWTLLQRDQPPFRRTIAGARFRTQILTSRNMLPDAAFSAVGGERMSKDTKVAAQWRELAAHALSAAQELTDPEARAVMLDIASRYERLAQYAEARAARKEPDKLE